MNICVVIPVLNEAKGIGPIVSSIKDRGLDVLVIDDGSDDGSGQIAEEMGADIIRHESRQGKGFSLRAGFNYIVEQDCYDGVIAMDGDGQHDVSDIDKFIDMAKLQPDSVISGNRMSDASNMPWLRVATNKAMSLLISLTCRQKIPDSQCGYRYIGCRILKEVNFTSVGFEIESEIMIKSSKKGYKIFAVPIQSIYGEETSHINPVKDTIKFLAYYLKEIFSS